ncbi:MAG: UvrD-helicase domain-containing protein [Betaproteobacteria bacterium]|nr:UvrD-helicase domain-containing protein [Betaproteobacteria bacterium]
MTTAMTRELELLACPLTGRVLIEASAGTGKTWSICALIARLVLEKHLELRQILVLTFTRAATAELKTRVHARLEEALRHITAAASDDPLLAALFAKLENDGQSRAEMAARLKQALSSFDEAAILTMHAFCQRVLADMPLLARQPLAMNCSEEGDAGGGLLTEVAADFWRRRVIFGDEPALFLDWLNERKFSPEHLKRLALRHMQRPLAEARWPEALAEAPPEAELQTAFAAAASIWQAEQEVIFTLLADKINARGLNAVSYKADKLPLWRDAWSRYFAAAWPTQTFAEMKFLCASYLAAKSNKGHEPPEHPFFLQADKLCAWANAGQHFCETRLIGLQRDFLEFFPAALANLKRRQRHLDFNDMLLYVYQALQGENGNALANRLRETYPAALIDEFQDTDPLQYAIFQAIYADAADTALFFVGDPKQAIYSFRQADLPTYFAARQTVAPEQTFGLNHNQRSAKSVLAGINALFCAQANPFMLDGLTFPEAARGEKPLPHFADESGLERPAFSFWQPPETDEKEAALWAIKTTAAEIARLLAAARAGKIRINNAPMEARRIAVLVRTNKEGRQVRRALAAFGVRAVELSLASVYKSETATELAPLLAAMLAPRDIRRIKAALATRLFGFSAPDIWGLADFSPLPLAGSCRRQLGSEERAERDDRPENNESLLTSQIELFSRANRLWQEKGILAALTVMEAEGKFSARLLALPNGERSLTDYLHLQELLHGDETAGRLTPERLFEAFSLALQNPPGGEATQIRLESGLDLVRIVTIHKAKGLEYDIVFCPLLWKNHHPPPDKIPGEIYHEEGGASVIDYRPETAATGRQLARLEQAEESLRLIYVALTRAALRCYLVCNPLPANSLLNWLAAGEHCTPLTWLGKEKKRLPDEDEIRIAWRRIAEAAGSSVDSCPLDAAATSATRDVGWGELANPNIRAATAMTSWGSQAHPNPHSGDIKTSVYAASSAEDGEPFSPLPLAGEGSGERVSVEDSKPRVGEGSSGHNYILQPVFPTRSLYSAWRLESFSGLTRGAAWSGEEREHDATSFAENEFEATEQGSGDSIPDHDILNFPKGARAGDCIHAFFEQIEFTDPATFVPAATRALQAHPQPVRRDAERVLQQAQLLRLADDTLATPLPLMGETPLCLNQLSSDRCLRELSFHLPARNLDPARLAKIMTDSGEPLPNLVAPTLNGYLKGFIDLVFAHEGRYYILDWKSNHLGWRQGDYAASRLAPVMQRHGYYLQARLYMLALHRYLRGRLADYKPARHLGGACYLFVRGLRPDWTNEGKPAGFYWLPPNPNLLSALELELGD